MASRGRGIRARKVEAPRPRRSTSNPGPSSKQPVSFPSGNPVVDLLEEVCQLLHSHSLRAEKVLNLSQMMKQHSGSLEAAYRDHLDNVFNNLRLALMEYDLNPLVRISLLELVELRAHKWHFDLQTDDYYKKKSREMTIQQKRYKPTRKNVPLKELKRKDGMRKDLEYKLQTIEEKEGEGGIFDDVVLPSQQAKSGKRAKYMESLLGVPSQVDRTVKVSDEEPGEKTIDDIGIARDKTPEKTAPSYKQDVKPRTDVKKAVDRGVGKSKNEIRTEASGVAQTSPDEEKDTTTRQVTVVGGGKTSKGGKLVVTVKQEKGPDTVGNEVQPKGRIPIIVTVVDPNTGKDKVYQSPTFVADKEKTGDFLHELVVHPNLLGARDEHDYRDSRSGGSGDSKGRSSRGKGRTGWRKPSPSARHVSKMRMDEVRKEQIITRHQTHPRDEEDIIRIAPEYSWILSHPKLLGFIAFRTDTTITPHTGSSDSFLLSIKGSACDRDFAIDLLCERCTDRPPSPPGSTNKQERTWEASRAVEPPSKDREVSPQYRRSFSENAVAAVNRGSGTDQLTVDWHSGPSNTSPASPGGETPKLTHLTEKPTSCRGVAVYTLSYPRKFIGRVIGVKGSRIKRVEQLSDTRISLDRDTDGPDCVITIRGPSEESLRIAVGVLDQVISENKTPDIVKKEHSRSTLYRRQQSDSRVNYSPDRTTPPGVHSTKLGTTTTPPGVHSTKSGTTAEGTARNLNKEMSRVVKLTPPGYDENENFIEHKHPAKSPPGMGPQYHPAVRPNPAFHRLVSDPGPRSGEGDGRQPVQYDDIDWDDLDTEPGFSLREIMASKEPAPKTKVPKEPSKPVAKAPPRAGPRKANVPPPGPAVKPPPNESWEEEDMVEILPHDSITPTKVAPGPTDAKCDSKPADSNLDLPSPVAQMAAGAVAPVVDREVPVESAKSVPVNELPPLPVNELPPLPDDNSFWEDKDDESGEQSSSLKPPSQAPNLQASLADDTLWNEDDEKCLMDELNELQSEMKSVSKLVKQQLEKSPNFEMMNRFSSLSMAESSPRKPNTTSTPFVKRTHVTEHLHEVSSLSAIEDSRIQSSQNTQGTLNRCLLGSQTDAEVSDIFKSSPVAIPNGSHATQGSSPVFRKSPSPAAAGSPSLLFSMDVSRERWRGGGSWRDTHRSSPVSMELEQLVRCHEVSAPSARWPGVSDGDIELPSRTTPEMSSLSETSESQYRLPGGYGKPSPPPNSSENTTTDSGPRQYKKFGVLGNFVPPDVMREPIGPLTRAKYVAVIEARSTNAAAAGIRRMKFRETAQKFAQRELSWRKSFEVAVKPRLQYGANFLLACSKSPLTHIPPPDWDRLCKELPEVCRTKCRPFEPAAYEDFTGGYFHHHVKTENESHLMNRQESSSEQGACPKSSAHSGVEPAISSSEKQAVCENEVVEEASHSGQSSSSQPQTGASSSDSGLCSALSLVDSGINSEKSQSSTNSECFRQDHDSIPDHSFKLEIEKDVENSTKNTQFLVQPPDNGDSAILAMGMAYNSGEAFKGNLLPEVQTERVLPSGLESDYKVDEAEGAFLSQTPDGGISAYLALTKFFPAIETKHQAVCSGSSSSNTWQAGVTRKLERLASDMISTPSGGNSLSSAGVSSAGSSSQSALSIVVPGRIQTRPTRTSLTCVLPPPTVRMTRPPLLPPPLMLPAYPMQYPFQYLPYHETAPTMLPPVTRFPPGWQYVLTPPEEPTWPTYPPSYMWHQNPYFM